MRVLACLGIALVAAAAASEPRREDHGDLVVLHVEGTYREMGRQQVELLGAIARDVYAFDRADYARSIAEAGLIARAFDRVGMPIASAMVRGEESGIGEQLAGFAEGLGVAPRDAMRAAFALDAASTVFLATRAATADGAALIGRNVDWGDAGGLRRPVVTVYRPSNGDLAHIAAAWPLVPIPTVGLNEAGFALSMNYFETEPILKPFGGTWPHRRALQTARTVEEGIRVFADAGADIAFSCFMAMADAGGAIGMVECRAGAGCAVFRPEGDWFAHANHARSAEMIPHDRYRSPDSFARQRGMEDAVRRALGKLTPELATEALRDRTGHRYPNATTVANLFVLNAAVVAPKAGVLWHSTAMQPFAPFGSYVGVSLTQDSGVLPVLPAAQFERETFRRERDVIHIARKGVAALRAARDFDDPVERRAAYETADFLWREVLRAPAPGLDPARVALARALALQGQGEIEAAYDALAPTESPGAPFEARAEGLASRALLADRLGRREDAVRLWRATLAHLDAAPEYNVFGPIRALAEEGLVRPARAEELPISWWDLGIPR